MYSATTDVDPSGYSDTTDIVTPQSLLATYLRSTVTLASSGCIRMYLQHRYSYTTDIVTALGRDTSDWKLHNFRTFTLEISP